MKKLRYGIVSASSIVPRFINAVLKTDHSEVIAIASASQKDLGFNIPKRYSNYIEMYQDEEIDIVYIANINDQHVTEIRNALNYGKHVLCEKPFVLHPDEVEELFELTKERNLFLMEAQKSPFLPVSKHLKKIVENKELGQLRQITMNNSYAGRVPENHWMHQAHQGGIWIPSANYILEYLHVLLGESPIEVQPMFLTYSKERTLDTVMLNLRYSDDVLAQVSLTTRYQSDDISKFFFDEGYVEIYQNWKARSLTIHRHDGSEPEKIEYPVDYELVYEVDHVYEMISNGKITSDVITPEVTYDCVSLVHEVYLMSQED